MVNKESLNVFSLVVPQCLFINELRLKIYNRGTSVELTVRDLNMCQGSFGTPVGTVIESFIYSRRHTCRNKIPVTSPICIYWVVEGHSVMTPFTFSRLFRSISKNSPLVLSTGRRHYLRLTDLLIVISYQLTIPRVGHTCPTDRLV